jgi:hypothetical protein
MSAKKPDQLYDEIEGLYLTLAYLDGYHLYGTLLEEVKIKIEPVDGGLKATGFTEPLFVTHLDQALILREATDYVQTADLLEHPETGADVLVWCSADGNPDPLSAEAVC